MSVIAATGNTFTEVPANAQGEPMLVAQSEKDYWIYIEWLADYLYRPSVVAEEALSGREAGLELVGIEMEIASAIWMNPYDDYPLQDRLPANLARHSDILHREAISRVLSRVPDRAVRIKLIHDFYVELDCDARK